MFDAIRDKLILIVLPLILAPLVTLLTQLSKRYVAWLDGQHALVKQGIAAGWAAALTALSAAVGGAICTDGGTVCEITQLDWRVVLTWAFSLAIHGWKKKA